jgi:uncharacterized protein DUF397
MSLNGLEDNNFQWRKAKRSAGNGACVEVGPANGQIFIRDSKDQSGPVMRYPGVSWREFLADVKKGQFDLDRL